MKWSLTAPQEVMDLYGFLLRNRIVFINRRISDEVRGVCPHARLQPRGWHVRRCLEASAARAVTRSRPAWCCRSACGAGTPPPPLPLGLCLQVATQVVASLLALDSLDPDQEIKLYINCPQVGAAPASVAWAVIQGLCRCHILSA